MLRALLLLLLLANVVFFAWSRGAFAPMWPAPMAAQREPERVQAQVKPEAVTVLPAKAASAAISAARAASLACVEAGPLAEAELPAAESALAPVQLPEGSWMRAVAPPPPLWLVFAGRAADPAGLRARAEELKKLNLPFEVIDAPAEFANGFVLSRHATRAEAEAALAAASAPGLKGARVVSLPAPPVQTWLKVPQADADMQDKLKALAPEPLAGGFKPCVTR